MIKCLAKDRFNEQCRCSSIYVDDIPTKFCKFHQYMIEYTKEMLDKLELCKGCKKMYYFDNQELKTCEKCQERCEKTREKKKETMTCECGCITNKNDIARHRKSQKHINLINK